MAGAFETDNSSFLVLVNGEGQFSIWPAFRAVPLGWNAVGPVGEKQVCLDWIEANWIDMRPKSQVE